MFLPSDKDSKTFLLLYLNKDTFKSDDDNETELVKIIRSCMDDPNINIIVAYEKDESKGGCEFDDIFVKTPKQLVKPRLNNVVITAGLKNNNSVTTSGLYDDIAIPLYRNTKYRNVSLKQILCKMGAKEVRYDWKNMFGCSNCSSCFKKQF